MLAECLDPGLACSEGREAFGSTSAVQVSALNAFGGAILVSMALLAVMLGATAIAVLYCLQQLANADPGKMP